MRHPEWFRDCARWEAEAVELRRFVNQAVPGLFQTREYARAVFAGRQPFFDEETIGQRVAARTARQELMTRWPPPTVSATVREIVLRRPFGGPDVQRGQLEQLLRTGHSRHVEIQVTPTPSEEHAGSAWAEFITDLGRESG
ncbi:DUF5753 domain-containing protein [Streptomyces sp. AHU1]|uniref:DUF5753 domain-containing protein n=1 Tax=Streptomyces sp. AHU1 TaxID=3377215 RepID=UPI003877B003